MSVTQPCLAPLMTTDNYRADTTRQRRIQVRSECRSPRGRMSCSVCDELANHD